MRLYCFYIYNQEGKLDKYEGLREYNYKYSNGNNYCLYAYTDKKKYFKEFKKYRDMNIFICKELDISKEQYDIFKVKNGLELLEYRNYQSEVINDKQYIKTERYILSTENEYNWIQCYSYTHFDYLMSGLDPILLFTNIDYFKKKYRDILDNYFLYDTLVTDIYPSEESAPFYEFELDYISLYCNLFNNTYKKGEIYNAVISVL